MGEASLGQAPTVTVASVVLETMIGTMGLPAFLRASTEHASGASSESVPLLTPEVDEACSALWERARSAWATRPAEGTPVEDEALRATFALFLEVTRSFVGHPQAAQRALVNDALRRVMLEQRETAETDRSFALRQLEQALEHYGVAIETIAMDDDLDGVVAEAILAADDTEGAMPLELRSVYRAHGALLMGFEAMTSGPADEFLVSTEAFILIDDGATRGPGAAPQTRGERRTW